MSKHLNYNENLWPYHKHDVNIKRPLAVINILHELSLFEMTFYQALKQVNYCTYFLIEIFLVWIFMGIKN